MDIRAILKARNLNDEQIENLVTKPEYASLLESFITEAENGKTAYQKAQELETKLNTWNQTEVAPYIRKADEEKAAAIAESAKLKAHMKALKDSGYDIPDAYLEAPVTPTTPAAPTHVGLTAEDIDKRAMEIAKTNMTLVTLSNRHRKLTGDELDLDAEYSDFGTNKRPNENLREYIARKYDHSGLQAKADQAKKQKELDDYADTKLAAEKAKWQLNNGPNPETRNPKSSRWDEIKGQENRVHAWQTRTGREQANKDRLAKYTALVTQ